ncbi:MAG TPA: hypothetical protein VG935_01515 [Patescibacteria group bacterium]|nr:hypothetical protein [Patescibacteria group bacterium]
MSGKEIGRGLGSQEPSHIHLPRRPREAVEDYPIEGLDREATGESLRPYGETPLVPPHTPGKTLHPRQRPTS